jgi:Baseplate J-like protein
MAKSAPKIDPRTAADIVEKVRSQLAINLPQEFPTSTPLTGFNLALVNIFARYCEIIIQRLNQVPQKNFLAFLDLLGASPLPPQPARVPLTFSLGAGTSVDAIVPAGTQVAAPPALGESEPVIFETERELVVTAAELTHIFVRDPETDRFADLSQLIRQDAAQALEIFKGKDEIEHILYLGEDTLLGYDDLDDLLLKFNLTTIPISGGDSIDSRILEWEIWDGDRGMPILPLSSENTESTQPRIKADNTENLTTNGDCFINFGNLPVVPQQTVANISSRWLRCRLKTRITRDPQSNMVRESQLPIIINVTFQANLGKKSHSIAYAFTNQLPIDLSKPFYPFGEKPKYGDTLYLGSSKSFAKAGANVTLTLDLANLETLGLLLPNAIKSAEIEVELTWEIWTITGWLVLRILDSTNAFRGVGAREIKFQLPQSPGEEPQLTLINGIESFWVRVRISRGNYGVEGSYVEVSKDPANPDPNKPGEFKFNPPTFRPPLIEKLSVAYARTTEDGQPNGIVAYNDFNYRTIAISAGAFAPFKPFTPIDNNLLAPDNNLPTLYLGFRLPENRQKFPNRKLSLYCKLAQSFYQPKLEPDNNIPATDLIWEYWDATGDSWQKFRLEDDTKAFTRPGLLEFLPPATFGAKTDFNLDKPDYWLRAYWKLTPDRKSLPSSPQLSRVLLNTMLATQSIAIRDEILGSSDGSDNQIFNTTKIPVLPAQRLDVREIDVPSAADRAKIERIEGQEAIAISRDLAGNPQEIWVRWHEVIDFYGSSAVDRHYVLNNVTGEIRFGNGISGKIPPIGTGNIRMTHYRTGGGNRGNCPAGSIVQLKTTIPYVDSVTNPVTAAGGADPERIENLIDRAPRQIRHGDRAVTIEDYEDLAIEASPAVARAKCFPLLNLSQNPFDLQNLIDRQPQAPGVVSIIIVPRSPDPKPLPSIELLDRVQSYIAARSIATATIAVVGPLYIRFDVTAEIATISLEGISAIEQNIRSTLDRFLHPLTGGSDNTGWAFGRTPHLSDFYALLESIPGIDHIRSLTVKPVEDFPEKTQGTKRFLVYSGTHTITFS